MTYNPNNLYVLLGVAAIVFLFLYDYMFDWNDCVRERERSARASESYIITYCRFEESRFIGMCCVHAVSACWEVNAWCNKAWKKIIHRFKSTHTHTIEPIYGFEPLEHTLNSISCSTISIWKQQTCKFVHKTDFLRFCDVATWFLVQNLFQSFHTDSTSFFHYHGLQIVAWLRQIHWTRRHHLYDRCVQMLNIISIYRVYCLHGFRKCALIFLINGLIFETLPHEKDGHNI